MVSELRAQTRAHARACSHDHAHAHSTRHFGKSSLAMFENSMRSLRRRFPGICDTALDRKMPLKPACRPMKAKKRVGTNQPAVWYLRRAAVAAERKQEAIERASVSRGTRAQCTRHTAHVHTAHGTRVRRNREAHAHDGDLDHGWARDVVREKADGAEEADCASEEEREKRESEEVGR